MGLVLRLYGPGGYSRSWKSGMDLCWDYLPWGHDDHVFGGACTEMRDGAGFHLLIDAALNDESVISLPVP